MEPSAPYLGCQPLVDRQHRLLGHRLFGSGIDWAALLQPLAGDEGFEGPGATFADGPGVSRPHGLFFIDVDAGSLADSSLRAIDPRRRVLQVGGASRDLREFFERARQARGARPMFSLADGSPGSAWLTQVDLFDYVRVDARALPTEHLGRYLSALKRRGPQLIATGLTSREDQRRAQDAGADLFEGYWFERPETGASQGVAPIYGAVMRTLALVRAEAPFREIEQTVRADATLAFRLLRFVNSAAFALPAEIGSIADAIALLGYRQIGRWLGLSLVTAKVDAGAHAPLASTAISRGRLMELLSQSGVDGVDPGDAFMVGLFSMLDALLDMPVERVVQTLSPPPPVARALLERTGPLGQMLSLIEACEDPSRVRIAELAQALRLEAATLARLRVQALDWAERQLQ